MICKTKIVILKFQFFFDVPYRKRKKNINFAVQILNSNRMTHEFSSEALDPTYQTDYKKLNQQMPNNMFLCSRQHNTFHFMRILNIALKTHGHTHTHRHTECSSFQICSTFCKRASTQSWFLERCVGLLQKYLNS